MPKEHEKIKYLPGEKSLKTTFIAYADLECLLKKMQFCQNNRKNSYAEKKSKHKPSGYSWCSIFNFKKKEMIPLTNKEIKPCEK